jgi:hypothetical protein
MTPYNKVIMITFVTLSQISYGWAAYLSVTYTQLGVPQSMLGLSGGLAGTARYAGGAVASACYSSAIANGIAKRGGELIPKAALAAGLPQSSVAAVQAAAGLGAAALEKIPGMTPQAAEAVVTAYKYAVAYGLRYELRFSPDFSRFLTPIQKCRLCINGFWRCGDHSGLLL